MPSECKGYDKGYDLAAASTALTALASTLVTIFLVDGRHQCGVQAVQVGLHVVFET